MRKTKIICTIGPACRNEETLTAMIRAGMNVARLNFSHGTHAEHLETIDMLKRVREKLNVPLAIMLDTKGPEYRIRSFENGSVFLNDGDDFTFTTDQIVGNEHKVSVSYPGLADELSVGDTILLNNALLNFEVVSIDGHDINCRVVSGGELSNNKSMSFPGKTLKQKYVSEQDRSDILFGIENDVDFIACSFVSCKQDLLDIKAVMGDSVNRIDLIAKIENRTGIDNIDDICTECDGIMIARGDMGVEIPFIKLPEIQKTIIRKVVSRGKYVITATQMLESMTTAPRPTRAEISDVANAVYDGTSAVMLSAESAAGKYPIESVKALDAICSEAEENGEFTALHEYVEEHGMKDTNPIRSSICKAAKNIAQAVGAKAIIVESATGRVARAMVHYRPDCPVIAVATSQLVCRKLCLNWGVMAVMGEEKRTSDSITKQAMEKALSTGVVKKGDTVVVLSSNKTCPTSSTDSLNVRIL